MMDPSQFKDYYKVLGVAPTADQGEIKKTFRKLARQFHPDINKEPGSEARFKDISSAYDILGDESKRQEYDILYHHMQSGGGRSHPGVRPGGSSGQGFSFEFGTDGTSPNIEDIFNRLFGAQGSSQNPFSRARSGGFPFPGGQGADGQEGRLRGNNQRKGREKTPEIQMDVTMEEAFQGCKRPLDVQTPQGVKQILVTLPAGIVDGQTIRIGGGSKGSDMLAGERLIKVKIVAHRLFRLTVRDVELDLPLSPWEAALGCQVTVPTLGGQVRMRIPANSQSGNRLLLRGKGLPGSPPGNQTVIVRIHTPEAVSPAQIEAYERFAQAFSFDPRGEVF
ncbi:MAG: J domain-containing protein [Magnetococcales bacterium]|nr:J domain-containing protein [Magnetococcales bacterium]